MCRWFHFFKKEHEGKWPIFNTYFDFLLSCASQSLNWNIRKKKKCFLSFYGFTKATLYLRFECYFFGRLDKIEIQSAYISKFLSCLDFVIREIKDCRYRRKQKSLNNYYLWLRKNFILHLLSNFLFLTKSNRNFQLHIVYFIRVYNTVFENIRRCS